LNHRHRHDLLGPVVEALVDLAERSLADPFLFREDQFRIDPLKGKIGNNEKISFEDTVTIIREQI
jgi:hypothetical protein